MFNTLETTWDRSARRGWSTLASFIFQGLALSLLFAVPLLWMQGPPLLRFAGILTPPPAPASVPPVADRQRPVASSSNMNHKQLIEPTSVPPTVTMLDESQVIAASPDLGIGVPGGTDLSGRRVSNTILEAMNVAVPPPTPMATHPIRISHMAEGSLIYRVQPQYPEIARLARVQGAVQLRAIISRTGTIENLVAESGHPTLIAAAMKAVRQWRYRPYLLNGEPVEVETGITVNFVLGG